MHRRQFLGAAASLSAATLPSLAADWDGSRALRVGLIGAGWYGKVDLFRLLQVHDAEVVSVCDVDSAMAEDAAAQIAARQKSGNTPALYDSYDKLIAAGGIDAVVIGTPDHWHALPTVAACEAGLDVWVQKPISVDVREGQAMVDAAKRNGRIVQVGLQRRSTPHLVDAKKNVVEKGLLGEIAHAEVCCYYHMRPQSDPEPTNPPENLDYEGWTGPAPMRPYTELQHPRKWRAFMEYSNGIVGDMCVHMYDAVRWQLGLGWPQRVDSSGGILVQTDALANTTDTQVATFDHTHEELPTSPNGLTVSWTHRSWGDAPDRDYPWAFKLYGSNGTLKADVNKFEFVPRGGGETIRGDAVIEYDKYPEDKIEKDLERHVASAIRAHMNDWLTCLKTRDQPVANIAQGHISTASCILANISLQLGRSLRWDPNAGEVIDDDEANALLKREYRAPYTHPYGA